MSAPEDIIARERMYGIPDDWQRFREQAHTERHHGPRYMQAIRGARAMRQMAYWSGPSFVGVRPSVKERDGGMPVGWFGCR